MFSGKKNGGMTMPLHDLIQRLYYRGQWTMHVSILG